jgi:multidrug efflux pump subunit AcrA (membrane-fusion protein)
MLNNNHHRHVPRIISNTNSDLSAAEFPVCSGNTLRSALFIVTSVLCSSGCVQVDTMQVNEPPIPPVAPVQPALPEGPHWETPIVTGYERRILVRNGEQVQKGDLLVVYSNASIRLLEIQVEQNSLVVQDMCAQLERLTRLRGERAISQDELENTQLALDQARLRLEADTIRLDSMRFVKAPFDGIVRIDSTSNSPSVSVYPNGGSEVLKNLSDATVPPINP